ncbi:MAG: serine hydrolase [Bacteroidota bacterium]
MIKAYYLKSLLLLFLLLSFSKNPVFSQTTSSQIDSIVDRAMHTFNVAGSAVAVVKDGKIIHQKGYGIQSIKTNKKASKKSIFGIGSNSKAFTTAALAILAEEGKLKWNDKVVQHIPEFKMYNDYVTNHFNIKDLVTHRSGLGLGAGDLMIFPDGTDFTIDDIITNFQYFEPTSAFRTKFDYDNLLYFIAGEIIKRTSGMSWENFIEKRIFDPLEMNDSYAAITSLNNHKKLSDPHINTDGELSITSTINWDPEKLNGAAGGIYATAEDMAKWLQVLINKGKYGDDLEKELFSEASLQEMWSLHTPNQVDRNPRYNSHFSGYGLGWFLRDVQGNLQVSHTGALPGMLSRVVIIPDQNLGVVVLTNTSNDGVGVFYAVSQFIVDQHLGLSEFDWVEYYQKMLNQKNNQAEEFVSEVMKTAENSDDSHIEKADFIGNYKDDWFGEIVIYKENNQLWFRAERSPKLKGKMQFYKANTFVVKWADESLEDADAFVSFILDEKGKATGFTMKGVSPNIDFSYDFQDLELKRINEE